MSEWYNIYELWDDLKAFAAAHPEYELLSADKVGWGFGFAALHPTNSNLDRGWTIALGHVKRTLPTRYGTPEALAFQEQVKTAGGRQALVRGLNENPGPLPKTRWERLRAAM